MSEHIEYHLRKLLTESRHGLIEIQRNELAEQFNCVPAQINYVLTTRFTIDHGFLVESKRGGGGYIRILKLPLSEEVETVAYLCRLIGDNISGRRAEGIVKYLLDEKLITGREAGLMTAAVSRKVLKISLPARDQLRSCILKAMIIAVLRNNINNI